MRDTVKPCDVCRIAGRHWTTLAVMRDGAIARSMTLCLACASDLQDRIDAELRPKMRA